MATPNLQPYTYVPGIIYGIRCTSASYDAPASGSYAPPYVIPYPVFIKNRANLVSDSTITYDLNNSVKNVKEWHDYTYGSYNLKPTIVRTGNSDGTINVVKNLYANDGSETSINISPTLASQLVAANRVGEPFGMKQYKDNQLLSQQWTYVHFDGNRLLTDSLRQALFNNSIETEIKVLEYDANTNPLTIEMRGGKFRKYIWEQSKGLPLATAVMPGNQFFYFNSFEYGGGVTGNAFSGSKACQLSAGNTLNFLTPVSNLDVYVWATSNAFFINGGTPQSTGKTKGNWTLYKRTVSSSGSWSITGTALIDQVVMLPQGSQFQGNVYDNSNRITAIVNDQMMTAFFEYDSFGRLKMVRDEQGNILKTSDYQYQGLQ